MNFTDYPRITAALASVVSATIIFTMSAGPAFEPVAQYIA